MTSHVQLYVTILIALFSGLTAMADNPDLTPSAVLRVADAVAGRNADLQSYKRAEPSYDPASKTWRVDYRLKSVAPQSTGQPVLSVSVSDETGFGSTKFWLATVTPIPPMPPAPPRSATRFLIINVLLVALTVAILIWSFARVLVRPTAPAMTTVADCFDVNEALRLKMILGCAGIESFIPDENAATVVPYHFIGSGRGVRLQVTDADARKARLILGKRNQGGESAEM
jgi:hypothetical protein